MFTESKRTGINSRTPHVPIILSNPKDYTRRISTQGIIDTASEVTLLKESFFSELNLELDPFSNITLTQASGQTTEPLGCAYVTSVLS